MSPVWRRVLGFRDGTNTGTVAKEEGHTPYATFQREGAAAGAVLRARALEGESSCRLLIMPLFRGSSRFESLISSHHPRYKVTCECDEEDINDE